MMKPQSFAGRVVGREGGWEGAMYRSTGVMGSRETPNPAIVCHKALAGKLSNPATRLLQSSAPHHSVR